MTLSWMWRQSGGYHCDLVFVPDRYEVLAVQVGSYEVWTVAAVVDRSDHVPVVVDLRVRCVGGHAWLTRSANSGSELWAWARRWAPTSQRDRRLGRLVAA